MDDWRERQGLKGGGGGVGMRGVVLLGVVGYN